jgi:hypothetical protein
MSSYKGNIVLTKTDLEEQREKIQEDIICAMDGLDQTTIDNVCQIVVDRINILIGKNYDSDTK